MVPESFPWNSITCFWIHCTENTLHWKIKSFIATKGCQTQNCEQPFYCTCINLCNEFLNQRMAPFTWRIPCCESSAENSIYFFMYGMLAFKHCVCVCFWFAKCWQACARIPITSLSSRNLNQVKETNLIN